MDLVIGVECDGVGGVDGGVVGVCVVEIGGVVVCGGGRVGGGVGIVYGVG